MQTSFSTFMLIAAALAGTTLAAPQGTTVVAYASTAVTAGSLPTGVNVPAVPNVPNIPNIPNVPNVPNVPGGTWGSSGDEVYPGGETTWTGGPNGGSTEVNNKWYHGSWSWPRKNRTKN